MTDPALAHWLDEHRAHLCERIYHLIYLLQLLHDHDEPGLRAVLAQSAAVAATAAEAAEYLQHSDLAGSHVWLEYHRLGQDDGRYWREWYATRGAEGLRESTVHYFEAAVQALAQPVVSRKPMHPRHLEEDEYEHPAEHLLPLLHQLREQLAALRHDPHGTAHRAAAEPLLAQAAEQLRAIVHGLHRAVQDADNSGTDPYRYHLLQESVTVLTHTLEVLTTGGLDHPDPLENATYAATATLNKLLGR